MAVEEGTDAAQGTVCQSENQVKARTPALLIIGAAALLVACDAMLAKAVEGQHVEIIASKQSVLRYTWSRAAAGATRGANVD